MLVKKITFTDYDGTERTEEHCFHLNKAEVLKWLTTSGDYTLDKVLLRLQKERNGKRIVEIFDELIQMSYGKKSLDGRRFEKSKEILDDFVQTEAYSELFCELCYDAKKAAAFVNAILPKDLVEEVNKALADNPDGIPDEMKDYIPDILPPMA